MQRICPFALVPALLVAGVFSFPALAAPASNSAEPSVNPPRTVTSQAPRYAAARGAMGGGLIEFLFGGASDAAPRAGASIYPPGYADPRGEAGDSARRTRYEVEEPARRTRYEAGPARREIDPQFLRQVVEYDGSEKPGSIVIDTPHRFLYLVQDGGTALRYGIGVGRPGFSWAGVKTVSMKREWPDWRPPDEMLKRRPDLPRYMPGGPENPLGARALYLGSSLYRIHGSNEPWTIGTAVSSGCIRMRNEDVIDLYNRVPVGARVVVL
jgi:lipoprotein-anchoring transpeptidase ErfK/SrfK